MGVRDAVTIPAQVATNIEIKVLPLQKNPQPSSHKFPWSTPSGTDLSNLVPIFDKGLSSKSNTTLLVVGPLDIQSKKPTLNS